MTDELICFGLLTHCVCVCLHRESTGNMMFRVREEQNSSEMTRINQCHHIIPTLIYNSMLGITDTLKCDSSLGDFVFRR